MFPLQEILHKTCKEKTWRKSDLNMFSHAKNQNIMAIKIEHFAKLRAETQTKLSQ